MYIIITDEANQRHYREKPNATFFYDQYINIIGYEIIIDSCTNVADDILFSSRNGLDIEDYISEIIIWNDGMIYSYSNEPCFRCWYKHICKICVKWNILLLLIGMYWACSNWVHWNNIAAA